MDSTGPKALPFTIQRSYRYDCAIRHALGGCFKGSVFIELDRDRLEIEKPVRHFFYKFNSETAGINSRWHENLAFQSNDRSLVSLELRQSGFAQDKWEDDHLQQDE